MDGIWIDKAIIALKRSPSETMLLAAICYRAAGSGGFCTDSNRELGDLINVHFQTVSTLVEKVEKAGFVVSVVSATKANLRSLKPMSVLLTPYEQNAHRWREKKKNPYERITHTPMSESLIDSEQNAHTPISDSLTPYEQNAHSLYKEEKILEKEIEKEREKENENPALSHKKNAGSEILELEAEEVIDLHLDAEEKKGSPRVAPGPPHDFENAIIINLWNENAKYTASMIIGDEKNIGFVDSVIKSHDGTSALNDTIKGSLLNLVKRLLINSGLQPLSGEISSTFVESDVLPLSESVEKFLTAGMSKGLSYSIQLQVNHQTLWGGSVKFVESKATSQLFLTLTASFPERKAVSMWQEICKSFAPTATNAKATTYHRGSDAPPQTIEIDEEGELAEIHEFVVKLSGNRRLIETLSRLNKLRGQDAIDWIERFVTKQWSADNLKNRDQKDLMYHCQSWIEDQQAKQLRNEQRTNNRRSNQSHQQGRAETGSEIDRLAEEYFGS